MRFIQIKEDLKNNRKVQIPAWEEQKEEGKEQKESEENQTMDLQNESIFFLPQERSNKKRKDKTDHDDYPFDNCKAVKLNEKEDIGSENEESEEENNSYGWENIIYEDT